jgi:hypothetical protein
VTVKAGATVPVLASDVWVAPAAVMVATADVPIFVVNEPVVGLVWKRIDAASFALPPPPSASSLFAVTPQRMSV